MALSDWSFRRLALVWVAGLFVQLIMKMAPLIFFSWYIRNELPRFNREMVATDERWRVAEQADSVAAATQRKSALRSGRFSVTPGGDTIVGIVSVPSGRPDPRRIAALEQRNMRSVSIATTIQLSAIPVSLELLTGFWAAGQRGRKDPPSRPTA